MKGEIMSAALIAWIVVLGLGVLAFVALMVRELPSIRRELRLLNM
jgi:hypothetical protein